LNAWDFDDDDDDDIIITEPCVLYVCTDVQNARTVTTTRV